MEKIDEKEDNMEQTTDRDYAELLMLYQRTIDAIEKAKQRGWTVTYTTIAAQGAILGLFSVYKAGDYLGWIKFIFVLLSIGMTILGIQYIKHAQESLEGLRALLEDVIGKLGGSLQLCLESRLKRRSGLLNPYYGSLHFLSAILS